VSLRDLSRRVNADLKADLAAVEDTDVDEDVDLWIPTGSRIMDMALGGGDPKKGGWAAGRIAELFAESGVGKSTMMYLAMARAQQAYGGVAGILDAERTHTSARARDLGVDCNLDDAFWYAAPEDLDQGFKMVSQFAEAPEVGPGSIIGWDSLSTTQEAVSKKGGITRRSQQLQAGFRPLTKDLKEAQISLLLINHATAAFKTGGNKWKTTVESGGGTKVKYYCSQRVRLIPIGAFKVGEVNRGVMIKVIVVKTKVSRPPTRDIEYVFPLDHELGVNADHEMWGWLMANEMAFDGKVVAQMASSRCQIHGCHSEMFEMSKPERDRGYISVYAKDMEEMFADRPDVREFMDLVAFGGLADGAK
jgi:RecA/RadA recombinase